MNDNNVPKLNTEKQCVRRIITISQNLPKIFFFVLCQYHFNWKPITKYWYLAPSKCWADNPFGVNMLNAIYYYFKCIFLVFLLHLLYTVVYLSFLILLYNFFLFCFFTVVVCPITVFFFHVFCMSIAPRCNHVWLSWGCNH